MKTIFLAAFTGLIFIGTSCDSKNESASAMNDKAQKNIVASDAISKAFETGDVSKIDSFVSVEFIDHTDHGDKKGGDSLKTMIKYFYSNFKNTKAEKIREVADGDLVWSWMHYTGTSVGSEAMAKGPYDLKGIEITKFKDGKAVEHWGFMDMQDMMKMMPPTDMSQMDNMKKDTLKMK